MSSIRRRGDALEWRLRPVEARLLEDLLEQLDEAIDGPTDDPVVRRLFPSPLEDDDEDAALRAMIAGDLLLRRHEAIRAVLGVLRRDERRERDRWVRLTLRDDEPGMMLAVLNDVRLALGSRIGMTAVELRQLVDDDDKRTRALLETMDVLAWFQMQLLEHIDPVAARHDDPEADVD